MLMTADINKITNPINLVGKYIEALVKNIDSKTLPNEMDLIFDGGGFNGLYGQGVALYVSVLEKTYDVKIKRVSGTSIGALLALMYLIHIEYNLDEAYKAIKNNFQTTYNLTEYKKQIKYFVEKYVTDEKLNSLNDRLYITYYDIVAKKQIVVSSYSNRDFLIECIVRSSYLPYLSDDKLCYQDRYLDGGHPFIFNDSKRPGLFIRLITSSIASKCITSIKENNTHSRIILGVSDANDFFINGSSKLCSYTNKWNMLNHMELRMREIILYIGIFIIKTVFYIKKNMPSVISDAIVVQGFTKCLWGFYTDMISNLIT